MFMTASPRDVVRLLINLFSTYQLTWTMLHGLFNDLIISFFKTFWFSGITGPKLLDFMSLSNVRIRLLRIFHDD